MERPEYHNESYTEEVKYYFEPENYNDEYYINGTLVEYNKLNDKEKELFATQYTYVEFSAWITLEKNEQNEIQSCEIQSFEIEECNIDNKNSSEYFDEIMQEIVDADIDDIIKENEY